MFLALVFILIQLLMLRIL